MEPEKAVDDPAPASPAGDAGESNNPPRPTKILWKKLLRPSRDEEAESMDEYKHNHRPRWTMGILNDKETDEVPGKSSDVVSPWPRCQGVGVYAARNYLEFEQQLTIGDYRHGSAPCLKSQRTSGVEASATACLVVIPAISLSPFPLLLSCDCPHPEEEDT